MIQILDGFSPDSQRLIFGKSKICDTYVLPFYDDLWPLNFQILKELLPIHSTGITKVGWVINRLMLNEEFDRTQRPPRHDEVCMLAVFLTLTVGFTKFGRPISVAHGSSGPDDVVF